ncbi:MAG: CBS domain-containing protein [Acidobacteria bacterium]|nr:CBS domain-containing protein [Acidobacteriota bacterium]
MQTMAQLLASKDAHIWSTSQDTTVFDALRLMADRDIGSLVVMEQGRPVGIVSERDYTRKVILKGRSSHYTPVSTIMTTTFVVAQPETVVDACMTLMTGQRTRHVLVMEDDDLLGVVSIGDLIKATIEEQQFTITQLEQYIHS